jgi:lysyl endopeptidase
MHITRNPVVLAPLLAFAAALSAHAATPMAQAEGEYSRTAPAAAMPWRAPGFPAASVARMQYGEMAVTRLLELERRHQAPDLKVTQIGIGRVAAQESVQSRLPALRWQPVAGGFVAKIEIRSMDAMALRVGLDVSALHDRAELRFGGSARPADVVAAMSGARVKRLPGTQGLFWSPGTDGETQIIEIFRPKGVPAFAVHLDAPALSHLIVDSRNRFKLIGKVGFGQSQSCNVDTTCRASELGQHFVNAKNAVAHMSFVRTGGGTYNCTGTLLADTVPLTQIPYLLTANHCFAIDEFQPPDTAQIQSVANTLNTRWNYETTGCGNLTPTAITEVGGGAAYLYSSHLTDGMLLRLNDPAPAFAYFLGWNAMPLANRAEVFAIHHPNGDSKKVSSGEVVGIDGVQTTVSWLSGTTEVGSSGSGIFTIDARGHYVLRGGLFGGNASCTNSGSLDNEQNRDYYSRLDVDFANMKTWLEPQPAGANGGKPLIRVRGASANRPPAAASAPAAASSPRMRRAVVANPSRRDK